MHTRTFFRYLCPAKPIWGHIVALLFIARLFSPYEANAQRFSSSSLTINASLTAGTANSQTYYGARPTASVPKFDKANLGNGLGSNPKFDAAAGAGTLTVSAVADAFSSGGTTITYSDFYYRVYLDGSATTPSFTKVSLTLTSTSNTTSTPVTYGAATSIDLLSVPRVTGGGTYRVDIYYDGMWTDGTDSDMLFDPSTSQTPPYSATFDVISPAVTPSGATTTWQSTSAAPYNGSTDWLLASNWSNGVPNATANAVIPEATQGSIIVFPILDDVTKDYRVNNLTLNGTSASGKAQLTIKNAVLRVYGNITQEASGLVGTVSNNINVADSTRNSTLILAGKNQEISSGRLVVPDVIIAGSGYKYLLGTLIPYNALSFRPADATAGVVLQTSSATKNANGTTSYSLNTTGTPAVNLTSPGLQNGIINANSGSNETVSSYVNGYLTTGGQLSTGVNQTFGNIGLELMPNHNSTNVTIVRIIGDPLKGPTTSGSGKQAVPIQRQYQITGDDDSTSGAFSASQNTVTFHYLPSDFELNSIKQKNLTMFRTLSGNAPYTPVGGTLDSVRNVVVQANLPSFKNYYYTLGDKTNPLPVSLVAFTATRINQSVLLTWTTAVEQNNAGFEVQISTDGNTFRKLVFVASKGPNSTQALTYSYTDMETSKAGTRYYRLRQLDITGEETFSPVRVISFDGATAVFALSAYPNPFANKVEFNLDATAIGANGVAHVQLLDMTGRVVREQNLAVQNASLTLDNLNALRSGLYMARITLPDGSTKSLRVQKQ